ncbi:MAG TPA: hypothetical protein VGE02_06025 [Gemmatimonadales bacterium]
MTARLRPHGRPMTPRARALVAGALLSVAPAAPAALAAQASPFVPVDDPAYAYVDALLARGELRSLTALERPYTVAALRRATADADSSGIRGDWLRALRRRITVYDARPAGATDSVPALHGYVSARVTGTAQSSGRRELMLADDEGGVHPGAALLLGASTGNLAIGARIAGDQRLQDDPEFDGKRDGGISGRVEEAYVSGQWRFGELFLGRMARNWGPQQVAGLQVGDYAYSYDHLFARLGTERLRLMTVIARLDDRPGLYDPVVQRYLSVHRLAGRWRDVEIAATETYVYSGAGRGFEPSLANPLTPVLIPHYNEADRDGNVSFALDLHWRTPVGTFAAQGMVDDFQFESGEETTEEPSSYGVTVAGEGLPLFGDQRWFASYTRVSNLTYRTGNIGDSYIVEGLSPGRGSSDYDELRLGVDLAVLPSMPVRLYAARRRQGEGDYRLPFPSPEENADTPGFLAGRVARVTRIGASAAGALLEGVALTADVGFNDVSGFDRAYAIDGPVPLAGSGIAGRVRLTLDPSFLRRRFALF